MSEQRSFSNSSKFMLNGDEGVVKLRKCKCQQMKYFDMRFSQSNLNPERPYYKCSGCGEFDWMEEHDVIYMDEFGQRRNSNRDSMPLKHSLDSMVKTINLLLKVVVVLMFVVIDVVLCK